MNNGRRWSGWLILCCICLAASAGTQHGAVISEGAGSVTIDASRLNTVIALDAPWRFHPGDDPRFADAAFDDSLWPRIKPGPFRQLAEANIPPVPGSQAWARLHIHIVNATTGPLAISTHALNNMQYAVFANGRQIGASRGFASQVQYRLPALWIQLPQSSDVVLALHFASPSKGPLHYFSLEHLEIGQSEAVEDRTDLARYRDFEDQWAVRIVIGITYLAIVPLGLILLVAQRNHSEYLWLSCFCLCMGVMEIGSPAFNTGYLSRSNTVLSLFMLTYSGALITCLEFVAALADLRRRNVLRIVQATFLLVPIFDNLESPRPMVILLGLAMAVWFFMVGKILIGAYRRGRKECGFLLIPLISLPMSELTAMLGDYYPGNRWLNWQAHFGGVGYTMYDFTPLLFVAGLLAAVLYRFIRVSKDEQIAAAELEAAQVVQEVLITRSQPAIPGFLIESIYIPARHVGGDFFLLLSAPAEAGDKSLLVIMGDVSGKGLQAAMVVSTIVGGFRMQLSREPAELLTGMNRMLVGHVSGFATCCAVLIEQGGRMRIANAGNPSPYCDGVELVTAPGLPLGIDPHVIYEETEHVLSIGSRLAFVSDGVVEATSFPHKELFGFDRARAISTQSARAIAEAASRFGTGAPQADDITVLTIAYTGV